MPKNDTKLKKNSKKNNKSTKEKKPKKEKVYCGVENPIPNGYRLGSMKECVDLNKVTYYGIKKLDPLILNYRKNDKTLDENALQLKKVGLVGKLNKVKKDISRCNDEIEKKNLIKEYDLLAKEINSIEEKVKKMKEKKK
jgi:hypothetical protein